MAPKSHLKTPKLTDVWSLLAAFKKSAKKIGVPHVTVIHWKKQFSKVTKIPLKSLCARVRRRVAKIPTTTQRTYRLKAGDNMAENTFGVLKRNLTRMNLKRSTSTASLNMLSSVRKKLEIWIWLYFIDFFYVFTICSLSLKRARSRRQQRSDSLKVVNNVCISTKLAKNKHL